MRPDRNYGLIYDLDESELANLAYYFEHDYVDGRDPESYVGEAFEAFRRWQGEPNSRGLIYVDHGETLAIWDLRSRAKRTLAILRGIEREVYLYCDQNRGLSQIEEFAAARGSNGAETGEFLQRLISDQLLIHLDSRYLSLAVRTANKATDISSERTGAWPVEPAVM